MNIAQTACNECGKGIEINTEYFQKYGSEPFCADCLIHTECHLCERGLRLQPSRYQELGGDPVVCTDCDQNTSTVGDTEAKTSFWYGLTAGEKIVLPIVVLVGVMSLGVLYTNPEVSSDQVGSVVGSCILLTLWIIHRGEKNNPNT